MMSYKHLGNARRLKSKQKEKKRKEKKRKELVLKRFQSSKEYAESMSGSKRSYAKMSGGAKQPNSKGKKFCQICKDNNGKYWTHDTADCYFKKPKKETNAIEAVHKEIDNLKDMIKSLKKRADSDSDSD